MYSYQLSTTRCLLLGIFGHCIHKGLSKAVCARAWQIICSLLSQAVALFISCSFLCSFLIVDISNKPHLLSVYRRNKPRGRFWENMGKAVKPHAVDESTQIGRSLYKQRNGNYVLFLDKSIPTFVSRLAYSLQGCVIMKISMIHWQDGYHFPLLLHQ